METLILWLYLMTISCDYISWLYIMTLLSEIWIYVWFFKADLLFRIPCNPYEIPALTAHIPTKSTAGEMMFEIPPWNSQFLSMVLFPNPGTSQMVIWNQSPWKFTIINNFLKLKIHEYPKSVGPNLCHGQKMDGHQSIEILISISVQIPMGRHFLFFTCSLTMAHSNPIVSLVAGTALLVISHMWGTSPIPPRGSESFKLFYCVSLLVISPSHRGFP